MRTIIHPQAMRFSLCFCLAFLAVTSLVLPSPAQALPAEEATTVSAVGGYPFAVSQRGLPSLESLELTVSPDAGMVGQPGAIYVFSIARNGSVWSFTPNSQWEQAIQPDPARTNGLPTATIMKKLKPYGYWNKLPAVTVIQPYADANNTAKLGKTIYVGYGTNAQSMFNRGAFQVAHAEAPQTNRGGITVCKDTQFALCAASTCTALPGKTVTDNQGLTYPAASCICPILRADNLADLSLGNQVGSCVSPEPGTVYSTFSDAVTSYPQQVNGVWTADQPIPKFGICSGEYSFAQCWNWKCEVTESQNGIALANCTCPIQSGPIWGEGNSNNACSSLPVGATLPSMTFDPTGG
jgi:hypothetical protein